MEFESVAPIDLEQSMCGDDQFKSAQSEEEKAMAVASCIGEAAAKYGGAVARELTNVLDPRIRAHQLAKKGLGQLGVFNNLSRD